MLNVSPEFFEQLRKEQRNQFASRIVTLGGPFDITVPHPWKILKIQSLPNVEAVHIQVDCKGARMMMNQFT